MFRKVDFFLLVSAAFFICPVPAQNLAQQVSPAHTVRAAGLAESVSSSPVGVESLWYNPAGLAAPLPERDVRWSVLVNGDGYFQPEYLFPVLDGISGSGNTAGTVLLNAKKLITSSGFGGSGVTAIAYTGRNWGAALTTSASLFLQGSPFPLGTEGYLLVSVGIPAGVAFVLYENEDCQLASGIVFQPELIFFRTVTGSDVDAIVGGTETPGGLLSDVLDSPYTGMPVHTGFLFTVYDKLVPGGQLRFSAVIQDLFGDAFVPGKTIVPVSRQTAVHTGVSGFIPFRLGPVKFSLLPSVEFHNINRVVTGSLSVWNSFRCGIEFSVGKFLSVCGGLTSGYPCFSAEVVLFHFSLGCSWQTIETGRYIGDNPLSVFRISAMYTW